MSAEQIPSSSNKSERPKPAPIYEIPDVDRPSLDAEPLDDVMDRLEKNLGIHKNDLHPKGRRGRNQTRTPRQPRSETSANDKQSSDDSEVSDSPNTDDIVEITDPYNPAYAKPLGVESIDAPYDLSFEDMKDQIHEEFKIDDTGYPSTIYLTEAPSSWEGTYGVGPVKIDLDNPINQNAPDLSGIEQVDSVKQAKSTEKAKKTSPEASKKSPERKKSPLKWLSRVATAALINFQIAREVGFGNYSKETLRNTSENLKSRYEAARLSLGDRLIIEQRKLNENRAAALERKQVRTDRANRLKSLQKELVTNKVNEMNATIAERRKEEIARKISRSGASGYWI